MKCRTCNGVKTKVKVLDLFCGAGGMASGFARAGFEVEGVDICPYVKEIFSLNKFGNAQVADLADDKFVEGEFDLMIGGPPVSDPSGWSKQSNSLPDN